MNNEPERSISNNELQKMLWTIADDLRSYIDTNDYRSYILGILLYRHLSFKIEQLAEEFLYDQTVSYSQAWEDVSTQHQLASFFTEKVGYVIEPRFLFSSLVDQITRNWNYTVDLGYLKYGLNFLVNSAIHAGNASAFENIFDDLQTLHYKSPKEQQQFSRIIAKIILRIDFIPYYKHTHLPSLAFEFLFSKFAEDTGRRGGNFYTPKIVAQLFTEIIKSSNINASNIYDPTCGTASLLLQVGQNFKNIRYFGQELSSTTYNIARMNMLAHDIPAHDFDIRHGDVLEKPLHIEKKFDIIVANPPLSAPWPDQVFFDIERDERFMKYGGKSPKSKADFGFIQHMLYHLKEEGIMVVVVPLGVLFRGGNEAYIRKYFIDDLNCLDTIIALPANLLFNTSIPTCILIFRKKRQHKENILFIDASNEYEAQRQRNTISEKDISKITTTIQTRKSIKGYAKVVGLPEIRANDYNLNVPRYIDTFQEEEIDIEEIQNRLQKVEFHLKETEHDLAHYLNELNIRIK